MPETLQSDGSNALIQGYAAASHALTSATTFVEMADAIAQHMPLADGEFVTINHVTHDMTNSLMRIDRLAWVYPNQVYQGTTSLEIPMPGDGYPMNPEGDEFTQPFLADYVQGNPQLNSTYRNWLAAYNIISFANFPVRFAGRIIGVMGVKGRNAPIHLTDEQLTAYQLLANQLGALIQVNTLNREVTFRQELIERQTRTFAELTADMNYEQMAGTVARHMLPARGQFLGISQFTYDNNGVINGWRVLTSANRERVYSWGDTPPMSWSVVAPGLQEATLAGEVFVMPSIQNAKPEEISEQLHDLLSTIHVESYVNIPMMVNNYPAAALLMMSRTPYGFTGDEIKAFTNLGDQMATLIHSRILLEESQAAQKMALQLVETNRNISLTNSMEDIGQALMHVVPASVSGLAIALFDRPIQINEKPRTLETMVRANRNGIQPIGTAETFSGDLAHIDAVIQDIFAHQIVVITPHDQYAQLLPESFVALYTQGTNFITLIGLQVGTRLLGILGMASTDALNKTPQQNANLRAIGDQIGVTLENRSLLTQTTDSLNLVQAQFEASNAIYRSTNPGEILEVFNRLIGGTYQQAQIALVEPESDPPLLRITAEIRDGKTRLIDQLVSMDAFPAYQKFKSMETLHIADVATDHNLTDAERTKLQINKIDSMLIVPMVVKTNLVGVVAFTNRIASTGGPVTSRALRGMIDLAAIVVENRSLLQITGQSLEETQRLYEINRAILGAQDTQDVLRVFRELLAPNAMVISALTVHYDDDGRLDDLIINYLNLPGSEQSVQMSLGSQIGKEGLKILQAYWDTNREMVTIVEDIESSNRDYPIADYIRQSGARSFINIMARQGARIQQIIGVSFADQRQFTPSERRLFTALSDQIGIVLQNHNLLREAQLGTVEMSKRVGQLQGINLVSSRILRATNERDMVSETSEALVKLLGIDHCGITLVDANDPDYLIVAGEFPNQGVTNIRLPLRNNPLWDALQQQNFQPLYVSNRDDSLIEPSTREVLTNMGAYSIGLVPIVSGNSIIGGVGLDMLSPGKKITVEMLELAQILVVPLNIGLQNLRLLGNVQNSANQLREQVDTLRNLQQIEAHLSSAPDETTLLNQAVKDLGQLLKADHCGIALLDPSQTLATVVSEYPGQGAIGIQFTVAGNPLYNFLNDQSYHPVVINDIETTPILDEANRSFLRSVGTKSIIVIPLVVQNRAIGSIGIDQYSLDHVISTEYIDLAQTVCSQIAIALQNRRLVSEAERRAEQLQRINAFNQNAQSSLELRHTLEIMIEEASQMLPQNQMSISLFDKSNQRLMVVAQRTDDELRITPVDGDIIPLTGHMQTVWEKAESLYIPDLRAVTPDMDAGITLRSWLLVPVMSRGSVSGIVSVGSDQPFAYTETDIRLFSQLVTQFGVVLENIEAYRQSQQTARNESLVNDISAQLQRQLDIQGMLNVTAAELGKAIGARRARIRLATTIPESETSAE